MSYTLFDLIREEHIMVGLHASGAESVIRTLAGRLIETGYAVEGFGQDVWNREQEFPTGLPTEPVGVAIPHADPDNVLKSAVCVGVLTEPVSFTQMGIDTSLRVDAPLIFMLAIKEKEKQVVMIQQLVEMIQNPNLLTSLTAAKDSTEALNLITASVARET